MTSILAISTYGSHRVKDPQTKQIVSAHKIGYTSAAADLLLALYGDLARDVSSKRASYRYIQITGDTTVRHGYLLLKLSDNQLAQAETLAKLHYRAGAYLYRDGRWQELPNQQNAEYTESVSRSGPSFNPMGYRVVLPATGDKEAAADHITVEMTQHNPSDTPWYWLRGDTYPYREHLKRWGCRWSKKRKAWYFIGATLPDAVQQLIDELETTSNANEHDLCSGEPCSLEEAAEALGLQISEQQSTTRSDHPPRLFDLNETVYARHELETPDGKAVLTGTSGVITRLYNRNSKHGWSYDVDFTTIGTGWFFERELTSLEPIAGIRITHGQIVPTEAPTPLFDMEIKRTLIESGHPIEASEPVSNDPENMEEDEPKICIIKPMLEILDDEEPDAIISAVRETKTELLPIHQPVQQSMTGRRNLLAIPQSICGELTGSITGSVWCYGYGIYDGICVYVNMGGPRMAVEAIRAKLAKGDIVSCVPRDAPGIELTAGNATDGSTNSGMYSAFMQNIPEAKFTSLILCHEWLTQPKYSGASTTFLIHISDEQAMTQLRYHVTKLVKVPIFPEWTGYLWDAGQRSMLLRPTRTGGDIKLWTLTLDDSGWTRLITGGLAQEIIQLPQNA